MRMLKIYINTYWQLSFLKSKDSPCPGFPAYPLPAQEAVK